MAMSSKLTLIAATMLLTCGCRTAYVHHIGEEDPGLGETTKFNAAAQIINPDPVYPPGAAQPGDSGVKAQAAMKRYRTDAVKPVETMSSTQSTSQSGSGASR
jgi:type IV pilus biogenesis protein CpaD/CtpE